MKKFSKITALLLSLALIVVSSGCNVAPAPSTPAPASPTPSPASPASAEPTPADDKVDTSKEVKLIMYLIGDAPPVDNGMVFEKINEKMKAAINATLEPKYLGWGEYTQKYPLLFASGEDFDIIYSADWAFYNAQATKQGYWEITKEALEKYAPVTAKTMYPGAWDQSLVAGKSYMLPMNYKELSGMVYVARGDLLKKYDVAGITDRASMEKYLDAIAANEKGMIPIDVGSDYDATYMMDRVRTELTTSADGKAIHESVGPWQVMGTVKAGDAALNVFSLAQTPEYLQVVTKMKEYKDKGYWSKSAVVNTTDNRESFKSGKSAMAMMNLNTAKGFYDEVSKANPTWDIQVFDAQFGVPATLSGFWANGMSIFSKSKNPERALMALDLLRNDEEVNDLFNFGVEGVHYTKVSDHLIKLTENKNYPYDGNCNWGVRNDATWKFLEGGIPNFDAINTTWQNNCVTGPYAFFTFDDANIKNELAAVNDVFKSNYKLLNLGFVDDPATDIAKMNEKMKAAGADRVYAEIQRQLVEYVANKK